VCCSVLQCAAVCAVFSSVELTYFANYLEQKLDNDCDGMCVCGRERKPRVCCSVLQCAAACGSVEFTYFACLTFSGSLASIVNACVCVKERERAFGSRNVLQCAAVASV